jgi:hypothetical protein
LSNGEEEVVAEEEDSETAKAGRIFLVVVFGTLPTLTTKALVVVAKGIITVAATTTTLLHNNTMVGLSFDVSSFGFDRFVVVGRRVDCVVRCCELVRLDVVIKKCGASVHLIRPGLTRPVVRKKMEQRTTTKPTRDRLAIFVGGGWTAFLPVPPPL